MWHQSRCWIDEGSRYDELSGVAASKADFRRLSDMCREIQRKAFDLEQKIADMTPEGPRGWAIQARLLDDWMAAGSRCDNRDLLIARRIAAYLEGLANAERLAGRVASRGYTWVPTPPALRINDDRPAGLRLPLAVDYERPEGDDPLTPNRRVRLVFGFDSEWEAGLVGE